MIRPQVGKIVSVTLPIAIVPATPVTEIFAAPDDVTEPTDPVEDKPFKVSKVLPIAVDPATTVQKARESGL